jgi:hypothetical protein
VRESDLLRLPEQFGTDVASASVAGRGALGIVQGAQVAFEAVRESRERIVTL